MTLGQSSFAEGSISAKKGMRKKDDLRLLLRLLLCSLLPFEVLESPAPFAHESRSRVCSSSHTAPLIAITAGKHVFSRRLSLLIAQERGPSTGDEVSEKRRDGE